MAFRSTQDLEEKYVLGTGTHENIRSISGSEEEGSSRYFNKRQCLLKL